MLSILSYMRQGEYLLAIIAIFSRCFVVFCCMPIHEAAHAFVAYKLGDDTAKRQGRLTLNPLAHLNPLGTIMIFLFGIGYGQAVPVDERNFKNPKAGMALTALAGPVSNIVLAFVSCIVFVLLGNAGVTNQYVMFFVRLMFYVNCMLAMFNLIPISPLDGSKVLFAFLPQRYYDKLMYVERYGFIILIIAVNTPLFNHILDNGVTNLMRAIIFLVDLLPI